MVTSLLHRAHPHPTIPETRGKVMNLGWRYDLMVALFNRLMFRGRLGEIPRFAVDLAELRNGDALLDVGCGTGKLALLAQTSGA